MTSRKNKKSLVEGGSEPIRVLLVMEAWGKGGTETYLSGLAKTLVKNGFEPGLALLKGPPPAKLTGFAPGKITVTGLIGLARRIKKERPDCLSLHLYTHLLPVVALGRWLGVPVVSTLHIPLSAWGVRHRLYWRMAMSLSSLVVGVSKEILDELNGANIFGAAMPGGVGTLFFKANKMTVENPGIFHIAAIGRLEHQKDWPTLVKAMKLLSENQRKRIRIHFYGEGSELDTLKSLAVENGVRADFHGHVDKDRLAEELSKADLSVLPSRFEGLGLSALEGMAVGVPTITADFAASKSFIKHGVTGHVFPSGDVGALAKLISWHLSSRKRSLEMGQAGRKFARANFTEAVMFIPYVNILHRLIKGKPES